MWQQRAECVAAAWKFSAMSSFVGTNPETCISRQSSLGSFAKIDKSLLERRTSPTSTSWSNQSIKQSNRSNTRRMSRSLFLALGTGSSHNGAHSMTDHWTVAPPLRSSPTWVRLRTRFYSSLDSFLVSSAQLRLVECAQIKVNELFLTSCFPSLSLLVISNTPLTHATPPYLYFRPDFCFSLTFSICLLKCRYNKPVPYDMIY